MRSNSQLRHRSPWPGHLRIPSVQEARRRSGFLVPQYSGGKGRCHPLHVPTPAQTPFVSFYRNQTEPVLSGNALFTVSSIGTRGRLPRARQCRNCARGRAASGGALSMPSSAERCPRPPLASPPPR